VIQDDCSEQSVLESPVVEAWPISTNSTLHSYTLCLSFSFLGLAFLFARYSAFYRIGNRLWGGQGDEAIPGLDVVETKDSPASATMGRWTSTLNAESTCQGSH
jgi:hypothetical protein